MCVCERDRGREIGGERWRERDGEREMEGERCSERGLHFSCVFKDTFPRTPLFVWLVGDSSVKAVACVLSAPGGSGMDFLKIVLKMWCSCI